jgi:glucokinase
LTADRPVWLGTDGGATTSKVGGVWHDGSIIASDLLQWPTDSQKGPDAVVAGWVEASTAYLDKYGLGWDQVQGVGLSIPGPFQKYGVWDKSANLPETFVGYDVHNKYSAALADRAGRSINVFVGNDGNLGGVAEAQRVRGNTRETVLMLAPGSGLGCAYVGADGLPLDGDTLAGMEAGHVMAPIHLLGVEPRPCGCGRDWGCIEVYTSLAGLPYLLELFLKKYPSHPLASSTEPPKARAFSLRGLAQQGDPLALDIFDLQAKAMGLHVANLAMALDPTHVVIGGGLMDPHATTDAFRERYLSTVKAAAWPYLWPAQRARMNIVPAALGDLSQSIGAALLALYQTRG